MPTDPAPAPTAFPDVERQLLDRDESTCRAGRTVLDAPGAWHAYLNKVLPPVEAAVPK